MENNHNPMEDDGSLGFLKIPADETNKHFNCPETTQQKLINLTFWVCDYIEGVKTKFGENRTLVKIKMNRDDHDRDARKFFTNSREIKYVLAKIREMDKFPRRVRQRADISDCREPGGQARARPRFRRVRVLPQPNAHAQIHQAEFLPHGRASE